MIIDEEEDGTARFRNERFEPKELEDALLEKESILSCIEEAGND